MSESAAPITLREAILRLTQYPAGLYMLQLIQANGTVQVQKLMLTK